MRHTGVGPGTIRAVFRRDRSVVPTQFVAVPWWEIAALLYRLARCQRPGDSPATEQKPRSWTSGSQGTTPVATCAGMARRPLHPRSGPLPPRTTIPKETTAVTEPAVIVEKGGHILTVTLNRPAKRNAINCESMCRLYDAWKQ